MSLPKQLWDELRHPDASVRLRGLRAFVEMLPHLVIDDKERESLDELLEGDLAAANFADGEVARGLLRWAVAAQAELAELRAWKRSKEPPRELLHSWLIQPFSDPKRNPAVIAICAEGHDKDARPQSEVAKYLTLLQDRVVDSPQVALRNPSWEHVHLDRRSAFIFIGRPPMFDNCDPLEGMPSDLRFGFPKDRALRYIHKPLSDKFHYIRQDRGRAKEKCHQAVDRSVGRRVFRTDYAVVQRFTLKYGKEGQAIVGVVAGASSVGTLAGAQWLTELELGGVTLEYVKEKTGLTPAASSRFEALLEITAEVHNPPRPWEPSVSARKIFLNDSTNIINEKPEIVTLGLEAPGSSRVDYILIDDDDVRVKEEPYGLLAAMLLMMKRQRGELQLDQLLLHKSVQEGDYPFPKDRVSDSLLNYVREHIKHRILRDALWVGSKSLKLDCRVE
jgi:hypothetical protein